MTSEASAFSWVSRVAGFFLALVSWALRQFRFPYRPETLNPKFETPWPRKEVVESFTKTRSEGDRTLFAMGLGNVVSGTSEAVGFE